MLQVQPLSMPLRCRRETGVIITKWFKLVQSIRDPYRPERHYMRGPGTRWYAKHQRQAGADVP